MYQPKPVNVDNIALPPHLTELAEQLAEGVHERWAAQRIADGWTYGPTRDDEKKSTPCLVAYADLPEEEKEYDRNTALHTLKLVISLGYSIEKP